MVQIEAMRSSKNNPIANQVIVREGSTATFFSYGVRIAQVKDGRVTLDRKFWDYSKTTGKYRNIFLRETKSQTEKKIKQGVYKLADLNPDK